MSGEKFTTDLHSAADQITALIKNLESNHGIEVGQIEFDRQVLQDSSGGQKTLSIKPRFTITLKKYQ